MHVNPVGSGPVTQPGKSLQHKPAPATSGTGDAPKNNQIGRPGPGSNGEAKGVLRLIEEGHFKGVSAVRLRINFHEQLSALQQQSATESVTANVDTLVSAVNAVVDEFLASEGLDEGLVDGVRTAQEDFQSAVSSLVDAFDGTDVEGLIASLQGAFDAFEETLLAFAPEPAEPVGDGGEVVEVSIDAVIPTEGAVVPSEGVTSADEIPVEPGELDFAAFVEALRAAFTSALEDFQTSVTASSSSLADIPEPNGNGVAFAKFLDILNGLRGTASTEETAPVPEVNTEV